MATKPIKLEIDLKDRDAKRKLQALAREAGDLGDEFDEAESAGKAMARAIERSADDMISEIDATARAVEALDRHMDGMDVDTRDVVADLKRVGLTAQDIEQDAEELATALRKSEDVKVHASQQGFDDLGQAVGSVREESDRANDASRGFLGGMVGDSAAAATGIGPLGEAVSQLTEGIAEGEIGFKKLVTAGLGLGAIAIAFTKIKDAKEKASRIEAFRSDLVDDYTEALDGAENKLDAVVEYLREAGEIQFQSFFSDDVEDATEDLAALGMTVEQFSRLVIGGKPAIDEWQEAMAAAGIEGEHYDDVLMAAGTHAMAYIEQQERATVQTAVFGESAEEAARRAEQMAEASERSAEAAEEEAEAREELNDILESEIEARMSLFDVQRSQQEAEWDVIDAVEQYEEVASDAEATDRDREEATLDVVAAVQRKAEADLQAAENMAKLEGRTMSAADEMDAFNASAVDAAMSLRGPARDAVIDWIATTNGIPASKVTSIRAAINRGDVAEANRLINEASRTRSAAVKVTVDTNYADWSLAEWTRKLRYVPIRPQLPNWGSNGSFYASGTPYSAGGRAVVGENGPELVDLPMGSKVTPARRTEAAVRDSAGGGGTTNVRIIQNFPAGTRPIDVARAQRRYDRIQGVV
jgi:hypothetical protein